jgi:hypothetical protein
VSISFRPSADSFEMDHLPRLHYSFKPYPKIPFSGTEKYDPKVPFQKYPSRCGWSSDKLLQGDIFQGHDKKTTVSFLQNWLYFGVLWKLSSFLEKEFDPKNYIKQKGNRKIVTSEKLEKLVKRWAKRLQNAKPERQSSHLQQTNRILAIMASVSQRLYQLRLNNPKECPLDFEVVLSIKILGCTIDNALLDLELVASSHDWELDVIAERRMRHRGWCPRDVALVWNFLSPLQMYCATFIRRRCGEKSQDHVRCSDTTCLANQINESVYQTKHRCPHGKCTLWEPDMKELEAIVKADRFPYVEMRPDKGSEDLALSIGDRRKPGHIPEPVVVVSHVWSDG